MAATPPYSPAFANAQAAHRWGGRAARTGGRASARASAACDQFCRETPNPKFSTQGLAFTADTRNPAVPSYAPAAASPFAAAPPRARPAAAAAAPAGGRATITYVVPKCQRHDESTSRPACRGAAAGAGSAAAPLAAPALRAVAAAAGAGAGAAALRPLKRPTRSAQHLTPTPHLRHDGVDVAVPPAAPLLPVLARCRVHALVQPGVAAAPVLQKQQPAAGLDERRSLAQQLRGEGGAQRWRGSAGARLKRPAAE
jgi:hypothetical protein